MDFVDKFYAEKDLKFLKKLTVVIPTYNRNYYLSRCLWYHSHFPFGEIIVADSSPEGKKEVNRDTVRKLAEERGVNIRYLEYSPETEKYGGDIMRKWGDAVQHVETEYSQICTDKEFLIPMTLCKCIAFMDEHNDYDMASGPSYDIRTSKSRAIEFFESHPGRSLSIDYPDPLARLLAFSVSWPDTFNALSLRRSYIHKNLYNKLIESGVIDLRFGELGFELLSVISSKAIFFPNDPHQCRDTVKLHASRRIKRSTPESSAHSYPLLDEYVHNGLYTKCMDRLASCLAHEYISSDLSAMTVQEANDLMKITITNLQMIRGFFGNPQSDVLRWGGFILSHFPARLSVYVRRMLNRPAQSPVADVLEELQAITPIIIKTLHLHNNDKPITINIL